MPPVHSADTEMLEHPMDLKCPGTPTDETAPADKCKAPDRPVNNSTVVNTSHVNRPLSPPHPLCRYTSSVLSVNTVDTNPTTHSPPTHPATLYDLLSPKLLHQHSLLTAVQQLLQPIIHLPSIPIETLTKLHATLRDSPRLAAYLPPLPVARHRPPPCSPHLLRRTGPTTNSPPPSLLPSLLARKMA